jgi:hypothetical protein
MSVRRRSVITGSGLTTPAYPLPSPSPSSINARTVPWRGAVIFRHCILPFQIARESSAATSQITSRNSRGCLVLLPALDLCPERLLFAASASSRCDDQPFRQRVFAFIVLERKDTSGRNRPSPGFRQMRTAFSLSSIAVIARHHAF